MSTRIVSEEEFKHISLPQSRHLRSRRMVLKIPRWREVPADKVDAFSIAGENELDLSFRRRPIPTLGERHMREREDFIQRKLRR